MSNDELLGGAASVKRPLQARSRQTLERLLDATEALLEDRMFADLTVREIATKAGTAIGSFYARFPEKDSLLAALMARYDRERTAWSQRELAAIASAPTDLEGTTRAIARSLVTLFRMRGGVLRALISHLQRFPEEATDGFHTRLGTLYAALSDLLLRHSDEISAPGQVAAVQEAVFVLVTTTRTAVVFGGRPFRVPQGLDDERLIQAVSLSVLGILQPRTRR